MLGHERRLAVVTEEAGGHGHRPAGIQHMDHWLTIVRRNLDGRVRPAGGCAADEQRQPETLPLHLAGHMDHLVKGGRDEAAEADDVRLLRRGAFENPFAGDHHPHVDDLVVVAGQNDADDVLANVVHVALDGCEHDLSLRLDHLAGRSQRSLLGFHEGRQVRHGLLHHAGRLDHLGQEHLAGSEQIAHHAHASHQRAFDDQQRAAQLDAGFLGVDLDVGVNPLDQCVRETFFDRAVAPFFGLLFIRNRAGARLGSLQCLAEVYQALGGVSAAVQEHILDQHLQLRLNLLVDLEHPGIHDAHVHARRDGVKKKRGVHGLADLVVASKAERDIGHAARDLRMRQAGLDPARGADEVNRVVVVLFHARCHGEDVGVEDDVLGRKADLDQNLIGSLADADLFLISGGLALFVEGHHHGGSAIFQHSSGVLAKLFLALFERDRVHDALALQALEPCLDDFPFRGVHHEGNLGHLGLAGQQLEVACHGRDAVDHALVHADVDDVGAVLHLLPGHAYRFLEFALLDQPGELGRTGHIGPLANHDVDAGLLGEGLRTGQAEGLRRRDCRQALGHTRVLGRAHAPLSIWPSFRGGWPSSALAIAAMCAGVLPQQPPAILIRPPRAKSPR